VTVVVPPQQDRPAPYHVLIPCLFDPCAAPWPRRDPDGQGSECEARSRRARSSGLQRGYGQGPTQRGRGETHRVRDAPAGGAV